MNRLVLGDDANVSRWVARRITHMHAGEFAPPFSAIGVTDPDGEPLAGVVYHNYQPEYSVIEISMAATSARWAQRGAIRALLHYPFMQLGANKCYVVCPHTNRRAIRFVTGIGFVQEAALAQHLGFDPPVHAIISRLFRRDFERLYMRQHVVDGGSNRQESTQGASAPGSVPDGSGPDAEQRQYGDRERLAG